MANTRAAPDMHPNRGFTTPLGGVDWDLPVPQRRLPGPRAVFGILPAAADVDDDDDDEWA
ncbi:hypothetical protein ACIPX0_43715 [Streptomyces sp. NPDC090075]|uniref:hypothetical protein n=1 Tax=Streptomyces sp. NPDC090075 TaxID=3365937 RepID=UPI003819BDFA